MRMQNHVIVSLFAGSLLWLWLRSLPGAAACFLAGVFVDLDHFFDYFYNNHRFNLRRFFEVFKRGILKNIFVFLHSWELGAVLIVVLIVAPETLRPIVIGLFVGFIIHLALDNIFNKHSRWAYFLAYRWWNGFDGRCYYGRREYRQRLKYVRRARRSSK